jgi:predicted unusual protein kinase regulating ubiquinone biosynthesis (AarF/ABC1/UbiB family)
MAPRREIANKKDSATQRALRMAAMSAGITGSYLGYLAQSAFLGADGRKARLKATHAKAGRRMATDMQALRGPAMKLGQLLSLQAGVLPEETLVELSTLQRDAPPMHPSLVRAQFRTAMGAPPESVLESFDETPFAAASLGQVHRAVTRAGEPVAVKMQYPGIKDAVKNDFKWFRVVSATSQMKRYVPESLVRELEEQILAETDYEREARNLAFFGAGLAPLAWVSTPRVHPELSRGPVLTMSVVEGESIEEFLARRPSQAIRDLVGERLLELFYFQVLELEAFHADPHWGNYLFRRDGTIGLVDFGCAKYLTTEFVANLRAVFLYPGSRDSAEFRELISRRYSGGRKVAPRMQQGLVRMSKEFYGRVYPPEVERDDQPFDFGDAEAIKLFIRESHELLHAKAALPEYVFLGRAESGLYNTLHRLKARVRTSKIVRRFL